MTKNMCIPARLILLGLALCAAAAPAQAQITFRAAGAQVATGNDASLTPVIPGGTQPGDLAILIIVGRPPDTTQPAAPAGWTLRSSVLREVGAHDVKTMTFYRVLTGGDKNPVITQPVSWRVQGLGGFSAAIAVWRGVNPTTPFDVADVTGNAAAATKWVPPAITTLTPGAWVVSVVGTSDNNAIEIDSAQGFTARMQGGSYDSGSGGGMAVGLADKLQATPGTPTMLRWEEGSNDPDPWSGITFALRPIVNTAPTVSLTSPANNATFTAPASIILTADAQDSDGTLTKVEFFQGTTLVATDTAAPFTFTLTNVVVGSYSFTARATDNQGASTTSAAVNVTVNTGVAQMYFIHTDHLNTPRVITNQAAQVVWRWDHSEPFGSDPANGNPSGLGAFEFNLRLPGQYFDKETNLHYNGARDYSPEIGRYVQADPVRAIVNPQLYAYVSLNPLLYRDPLGLAKDSITSHIEASIAKGDARALQQLIESGGLSPQQEAAAQAGLRALEILGRTTKNTSELARQLGRSNKEVRRAIEQCKQENLPRGGPTRNPDVRVDPRTGDVYPETPRGGLGDPIGNIFDYLK